MSFQDINIELEYRSNRNDVVRDFYIPVLSHALEYKRAVGFFSSTALIEISKGIISLVNNGGKIQLIASPKLSKEDIEAIDYGYKERNEVINNALLREITEPEDIFQEKRLNLLAYLIANDMLDIKIAYIDNQDKLGIFHDKLGILVDKSNNIIAFSGSMNESGMAMNYNYESIDVFCDWNSEESKMRVERKKDAFESIWSGREYGVDVFDFPDIVKEKLETYNIGSINENIDEKEFETPYKIKIPQIPVNLELFEYQIEAINVWKNNNYQGIYDMATGTGKTYTGLASAVTLCNECNGKLAIIIVCPYQHLVEQWIEDLELFSINYIVGHSGHKDFRKKLEEEIFDFNIGVKKQICFICTNATFGLEKTQKILDNLKGNILLLADEAHNLGTIKFAKLLLDKYKFRLALSATLERYGDDGGTQLLQEYFGKKCIEYTLERAIKEDKLTPYKYFPIIVNLNEIELIEYRSITTEIQKNIILDKRGKTRLSEKGKKLAIKRARLVAGAANKIEVLRELMIPYKDDNHILVYCGAARLFEEEDDIIGRRQIELVTELLGKELNMRVARFTSEEDFKRRSILKYDFKEGDDLQALIAIKCLDEGVNIPNIRTAFIMASTTNPKEYIQRRGRVLRKSPGKKFAVIYDFVTVTRPLCEVSDLPLEERKRDITLLKNEIKRVREFGNSSLNSIESDNLIQDIEDSYGFYITNNDRGDEDYEF